MNYLAKIRSMLPTMPRSGLWDSLFAWMQCQEEINREVAAFIGTIEKKAGPERTRYLCSFCSQDGTCGSPENCMLVTRSEVIEGKADPELLKKDPRPVSQWRVTHKVETEYFNSIYDGVVTLTAADAAKKLNELQAQNRALKQLAESLSRLARDSR